MDAFGHATWHGTWKDGAGELSTGGEALRKQPFSYASRFENAPGGSPEELLAVAEAGCFNQALANNFGMNALEATSVVTLVTVLIEQDKRSRPTITGMHVSTEARVPGATEEVFQQCAERARTNCTIARLLSVELTMNASLLV